MARLADRCTPIAPDLCGFGDSDKPTDAFGPHGNVEDLLALLDALQVEHVEQVGIVGHDGGGAVMRALARTAPQRCAGLFFSNFVYPGIGARMAAPDRLNGIWHQSFNQTGLATRPVGTNRESCGAYIAHFPAALGPSQRRVRQCPRCVHL